MSVLHVESERVAEYKRLTLEMFAQSNPDAVEDIGSRMDRLWYGMMADELADVRRFLIALNEEEEARTP